MYWYCLLVVLAACGSSSTRSTTPMETGDTGGPTGTGYASTPSASELAGSWDGTCTALDLWSMQLTLIEVDPATLDVDYHLERASGTEAAFEGVASGTISGGVLTIAAPVMPYTTGYTLDVNLDLSLELQADGTLAGSGTSFFADASCSFGRAR